MVVMNNSLLQRVSAFFIRARLWVVAVFVVLAVVFGMMIPKLKADFTPSDLFAAFGDSRQVAEEFKAEFGNTDNTILFLIESDNIMTPENIGFIYRLAERVRQVEGVANVQSLVSLPRPSPTLEANIRGAAAATSPDDAPADDVSDPVTSSIFDLYDAISGVALMTDEASAADEPGAGTPPAPQPSGFQALVSSPEVSAEDVALLDKMISLSPAMEGRLVSRDRTVANVVVTLHNDLTKNEHLNMMVSRLEGVIAEVNESDPNQLVSLGGLPYIRTSIVRNMGADQKVLLPASIIVSLLVLLVAFRWIPALVMPTIAVAISALLLVGGMAVFGENLNIINNIIPTLVIIIGISNAIHIINRYRENIAKGRPQVWSASDAMATMMLACFLSSITTAIGFASLGVAQTEILRRFGWTAGVGVMIAYVVTVYFVPPALTLVKAPKVRMVAAQVADGPFERRMGAITETLLRHRWVAVFVAAVLIASTLTLGMRTKIDSAVLDQVSPKDEVYRTTKLIEAKLGGIRPLELFIRGEEPWSTIQPEVVGALGEIIGYAEEQEGVITSLGYPDLIGQVQIMLSGDLNAAQTAMDDPDQVRGLVNLLSGNPQNPLSSWLLDEGRTARITIMVEDMGALKTNLLLDDLEQRIAARFESVPGVNVRLTGDAYIGSRGLDAVIMDLTGSLATAVVIIIFLVTLLFRSLRFGLVTIPPALMPLAFTLFWMWARGIPLNTATAIIFSIAIGLTVDGCIHILSRFREEYVGDRTLDEAIIAAVRGTGKAIVFTSLALIVGFGVMLISNFVPVRRFGELLAFTIFIMLVATIGTLPPLLRIAYASVEKRRLEEAPKS